MTFWQQVTVLTLAAVGGGLSAAVDKFPASMLVMGLFVIPASILLGRWAG